MANNTVGASTWLSQATSSASSVTCGALLGGALVLGLLGILGGELCAAVRLTNLPVVQGLLFTHPVLFPTVVAASGIGLVIATRRIGRRGPWSALVSPACGMIAVSCLVFVAAVSGRLLLQIAHALPEVLAR